MQKHLFYPNFKEEDLSFFKDNESGMFIVSKEFNFLDQLQVSEVGKDIIRACNGKNSVKDIIELLSNKYREASEEIIENDMMKFLHLVWRLDIITFDKNNHPFNHIYESSNGDYKVILPKDFDWMVNKCKEMDCIISPYRKNVMFNKDFYKHQYITSTQICFYNKNLDLFLFLERTPSFKYSINLNGIALSKQIQSDIDVKEFNKFLNWTLSSYNLIVENQKDVRSLLFYLNSENIENMLFLLNHLDFIRLGVLKNEVIDRVSGDIMSVLILQKNII